MLYTISKPLICIDARAVDFDNMYLNRLPDHRIHDGQTTHSQSRVNDKMWMAFMIAIISGICIFCVCIILIFSVCMGGGCAYITSNRKKMANCLEGSDIAEHV